MKRHRVDPIWPGEDCYIVAGGPSLAGFDFAKFNGRRTIVINSSVLSYPQADVLFFGDDRWWLWHGEFVRKNFSGLVYSAAHVADPMVTNLVRRRPPPFITAARDEVTMQHTSLTAAINLAVHFGCRRLVLLGADMQPAADGTTHHHEPHPVPQVAGCWDKQMVELYSAGQTLTDLGIEVINTSLNSRIDWWPKREIGELL